MHNLAVIILIIGDIAIGFLADVSLLRIGGEEDLLSHPFTYFDDQYHPLTGANLQPARRSSTCYEHRQSQGVIDMQYQRPTDSGLSERSLVKHGYNNELSLERYTGIDSNFTSTIS